MWPLNRAEIPKFEQHFTNTFKLNYKKTIISGGFLTQEHKDSFNLIPVTKPLEVLRPWMIKRHVKSKNFEMQMIQVLHNP